MSFSLSTHTLGGIVESDDDNVDVRIEVDDGRVFAATFFTIRNLATLMARHRRSGECAGGRYFWAVDMIVVERIDEATLRAAVADMISDGSLETACRRLDKPKGASADRLISGD